MNTNVSLDVVKFIRATLVDMEKDIEYSYPGSRKLYEASYGHASLQMIASKIEVLNNFLNALEQPKE